MPRVTCLNGHEIEFQANQFGQRMACPICQLLMVVSTPRPGEPLAPKYEVLCDNGHVLRVKSKYLGTQIRCPQCQGLAWVTTDRLQRSNMPDASRPALPVVLAETVPTSQTTPVVAKVPVIPVATSLDDIPVAEVDEPAKRSKAALAKRSDDDDEDDETEERESAKLTKAERRNLKLTYQGLDYFKFGVVGYCSITMAMTVLALLLTLIAQGVSSLDGMKALGTFSSVINWIFFGLMVLNTLLFLAGVVLTLFTPWITHATIWFILSLLCATGYFGWRIYWMIMHGNTWQLASVFGINTLVAIALELLFLLIWVFMIVGLWQLGRFARKPMTRQRVLLLGILGFACWGLVLAWPYIMGLFTPYKTVITKDSISVVENEYAMSKAAGWVMLIFEVLVKLGMCALLIYQHLMVVPEVQAVMQRRK